MEYNYYINSDNAIEIISIVRSFKSILNISSCAKYLANCIYYCSAMNRSYSLNMSDKFINIKTIIYRGNITTDTMNKLSNLTKLHNLIIHYCSHYQFRFLDIQKLKMLTSFHLEHIADTYSKKTLTLSIQKCNLRRLTLHYDNRECIITNIECPKLIYLNLNSGGYKNSVSKELFDIKYDEMKYTLKHLILKYVDCRLEIFLFGLFVSSIDIFRSRRH